jgi:hypothetical protein
MFDKFLNIPHITNQLKMQSYTALVWFQLYFFPLTPADEDSLRSMQTLAVFTATDIFFEYGCQLESLPVNADFLGSHDSQFRR